MNIRSPAPRLVRIEPFAVGLLAHLQVGRPRGSRAVWARTRLGADGGRNERACERGLTVLVVIRFLKKLRGPRCTVPALFDFGQPAVRHLKVGLAWGHSQSTFVARVDSLSDAQPGTDMRYTMSHPLTPLPRVKTSSHHPLPATDSVRCVIGLKEAACQCSSATSFYLVWNDASKSVCRPMDLTKVHLEHACVSQKRPGLAGCAPELQFAHRSSFRHCGKSWQAYQYRMTVCCIQTSPFSPTTMP
jgi:hypothetical protein